MPLSFLSQWFNTDVMKALTWTFVHSLWQGLLAALLVAVIISVTRRTSAKLRYNLLGTVLILFLITTVIHPCSTGLLFTIRAMYYLSNPI